MSEPTQPPVDDERQMNLFQSGAAIPDDILKDLQLVTGGMPVDPESAPSDASDPHSRLHPDFRGSKYEMLKKGDRTQKTLHVEEPKVKAIDIATPEGEEEASKILALVGNPENGMGFSETPPQIMLDPTTPRGFRTIVVFRWWKVRTIVKPIGAEAVTFANARAGAANA